MAETESRDHWTDAQFIEAFGERAKRSIGPLYLGDFRRPGYPANNKFYLIWCRPCRFTPNGGFSVTHVAGRRRLTCGYCRTRYDHLLPMRRLKSALRNPFSSPRFLMLLMLIGLLLAFAASRP